MTLQVCRGDHMEQQATVDGLTLAWSKDSTLQKIRQEITSLSELHAPLTVALVDLDDFEPLNKLYGSVVGDRVLKDAATRLQAVIRPSDTLGRYDGDCFLVVFPGCDAVSAKYVGERLRKAISGVPIVLETTTHTLTASIGIVTERGAETTAETLVQRVLEAVQRVKDNGKDAVIAEG
jgi:diguanylate cyclase (GGDEF)-like protein